MVVEIDISKREQILLNILPRCAALVSLFCALCIIVSILRSRYYRGRIYHRIMFGCGINIIVLSGIIMWGSAAVPVGTSHISWARGNEKTCSISGFISQISVFVIPQYYCSLSLLSYAAVRNGFSISKYYWVEKWIHIGVYIYPIGSAIYLLTLSAFNPVIIGCALASIPLGCGNQAKDGQEIKCTRGPQNIGQLQWLFWFLPCLLIFVVPILVLFLLYLEVRSKGSKSRAVALSIAKQGFLYILVLAWTYLFRVIDIILVHGVGHYVFLSNLLANTNEALIGLWISISYWYFRSEDQPIGTVITETQQQSVVFRDELNRTTTTTNIKSVASEMKPEFSIFDGNDIPEDSPWATYLTEGVDEDYDYEGRI